MVTWLNPVKSEGILTRLHHVPTNFIQENILTLKYIIIFTLRWEIIPNHDLLSVIHTRLYAPCDKPSVDLLTLQKVLLNSSLHPCRISEFHQFHGIIWFYLCPEVSVNSNENWILHPTFGPILNQHYIRRLYNLLVQ